ncbi:hypothetical protein [Phenylobacterium sp. J367]|uniref:hypothetical protein n=1 Tax=Phenylobacterium sp. J367 TaxID=2898435 RepID=UPI002151C2D3|nr:hypothetical protein [Phenylobacterium sp. J367]MCR5878942.1 hypothetical protein [Phenylobacterium sp. J367]
MPYLCYVHRSSGGVPHFEVLPDHVTRDEAIVRAGALLAQRPDGQRAEVWEDDVLIFTVPKGSMCSAG